MSETNLFEFVQTVPANPHRWVEVEGNEFYLVNDALVPFREIDVRRYTPLRDSPTLFREFVTVDADSRDAIKRFADTHGPLGIAEQLVKSGNPDAAPFGLIGEPMSAWQGEIRAMRRATWLFDQLEEKTPESLLRLAEVIQCTHPPKGDRPGRWVFRSTSDSPEGIRTPGLVKFPIPEPRPGFFKVGDVSLPAIFLVQAIISERLNGEKGHARVFPQVVFDLDLRRTVFVVKPNSLCAALWLQFADVVSGKRQHRKCVHCGGFFEIHGTGEDRRTARSMFCSKKCKMADHRRRKDEVVRLAKEGKTAPEISELTGSPTESVRKWIGKGG